MLETGIKRWVSGEEEPEDFYQLVGLPRLCRDRDRLIHSFEEANESLFHFQNHKDKTVRDRARAFHRQVAEARRIVSDAGRWKQYDRVIIDGLRALSRQNPSFSGPSANLDDLRRWLALVHQVDSDRVEELVRLLTAVPEQKSPPSETVSLSSNITDPEALPTVSTSIALRQPEPAAEIYFETYAPDAESPAIPTPKKNVPSPPARPKSIDKSPPPPPRDLPTPPPSSRKAMVQAVYSIPGPPPGAGASSSVLWVVMAAFVMALALGMLCLSIAWAAGAFEGVRPRSAVSSAENPVPIIPRTVKEIASFLARDSGYDK